jgi:hypothetical protein
VKLNLDGEDDFVARSFDQQDRSEERPRTKI